MLDEDDCDFSNPSDSESETICPSPLDSPIIDHSHFHKHENGYEHTVQFYDTQEYLLDVLTNFIVPVLSSRDAAVVIAVKDRLDALEARLRERGVAVEEKKRTGQLSMLDARETLDKLSSFDEKTPISIEPIGSLLLKLNKKFANIYAYGELVNLLCAQGDYTGAIGLEEMWNELLKRHKFTLLCGYDMNNFKDEEVQAAFNEICHTHSRVCPTEDPPSAEDTNDQDTMIAILKQKTKALETEVERRKMVEAVLQRFLEVMSTRAEESLRHQQHLYRTLLSFLPVGVYSAPITDTDDYDGVIVNERFCELTGMTEAQVRVYGWFNAVHIDDRDRVRHLQDVSNTHTFGGKEEYRYVLPDGKVRWVTGETVQFTSHEGKTQTYVHTIVDISELKEVEKQRKQASRKAEELLRHRAEQAEKHRREQDQFIDTLCHELRNPLSSIQGNVELLQIGQDLKLKILGAEHLEAHDIARLRDQAGLDQESICAIEKCAAHQKVITDDVLALSKLEVGKVVLRKVEFNPKTSIIDVTRMFEAEARRKGLTLRSNMPVSDLTVRADPDRVSQVLINLLANAVKCTTHGSITLGLDFVQTGEGKMVISITVKDTGIGLTKQEKAKLFHRFVQPTSSTYHEAGGSGLGLVISKGLVELMGGTISVESMKGQGSTFTFTFLAEAVDRSRSSYLPVPPSIPRHSKNRWIRHILIVEDNVINQRFLLRLLETVGFVCSTAGNGVEALESMEQKLFDLVLMDVHMPVMDGIASTREIRAREAKNNLVPVPIVGLSGNAREEHKVAALNSGMNCYLTKPCRKDELYSVIDQFEKEVYQTRVSG